MSDPIRKIVPNQPVIVMDEIRIEVKLPPAPVPAVTAAATPRPVELVIAFDRNVLWHRQLFLAHLYRLMKDIESKTGQPPRVAVMTFTEDGSPRVDLPLILMDTSGKTQLLAKLLEARTRNIGVDTVTVAAKKNFTGKELRYFGGEGVEKKLRLRPDETLATWQETIQNLSDWFQIYHAEMGETGLRFLEGKAADNRDWFFFRLGVARLKFPNTPLLHLIDAVRGDSLKQEGFLASVSDSFFVDESCTEKNVPCDVVATSSLLYLDLLREIGSEDALGRFVVYGLQDYYPHFMSPVDSPVDTLVTTWDRSNKLFTTFGKWNRFSRHLAPLDPLLRYGDVPRPLLIDNLISDENARSFLVLQGNSSKMDSYFVDSRGIEKLLPAESLSEEEKQRIVHRIAAVFQQDITSGIIWCAVFRYLPEVRELFDRKIGPEIFSKLGEVYIQDWEPVVSSLVYNFDLGDKFQPGIAYSHSTCYTQKLRGRFFQIGLLRAQENFDWNEWEKRYEKLSGMEPQQLMNWMYQSIPRFPWFARLMMIPLQKVEPGLRAEVLKTQKRIYKKVWKEFPEEARFIVEGQLYAAIRSWPSLFDLIIRVVERESEMSQKSKSTKDPTWYDGDHSAVSKYLTELFWEERREEAKLGVTNYGLVKQAVDLFGDNLTNFQKREVVFGLIQRGSFGAFSYEEMKIIVESVMSQPLRLHQREDARKILKEMAKQYPQKIEEALMDTFENIFRPLSKRFQGSSIDILLDVYLENLEEILDVFEMAGKFKQESPREKSAMDFWAGKYTLLHNLLSALALVYSPDEKKKISYFMAKIRRVVPDAVFPIHGEPKHPAHGEPVEP